MGGMEQIMGWIARTAGALGMAVVATVGGYLFGYDEDVAVNVAVDGYHHIGAMTNAVYRVTSADLLGQGDVIPFSQETAEALERTIGRLRANLTDQFAACKPSNTDCLPWSIGQVAIALDDPSPDNKERLDAYMQGTLDRTCMCWRNFGNMHVAASSWALLSLAEYGLPVEKAQLQSLMDLQSSAGWWPMFPSRHDLDYASTYATAMAVLALNAHLERGLVADDQKDAVRRARDRGVDWLKLVRKDSGVWNDYPHSDYYSISSVGLSGLVLYTLHQTSREADGSAPDWLREWDQDWLEAVPQAIPEPTDENTSLARIVTKDGTVLEDTTRHYKLPGTLLGIATAYQSGTPRQQVKALRWVEKAVGGQEIATRQVLKQYWLAAEILIALNRIEEVARPPAEAAS